MNCILLERCPRLHYHGTTQKSECKRLRLTSYIIRSFSSDLLLMLLTAHISEKLTCTCGPPAYGPGSCSAVQAGTPLQDWSRNNAFFFFFFLCFSFPDARTSRTSSRQTRVGRCRLMHRGVMIPGAWADPHRETSRGTPTTS